MLYNANLYEPTMYFFVFIFEFMEVDIHHNDFIQVQNEIYAY